MAQVLILKTVDNGENTTIDSSGLLILTNVSASDGGRYICVAINVIGMDTVETYIFISLYFVSQPTNEIAANGSSVNFSCVAEAFPAPSYEWQRADGASIRESININSDVLVFDTVMFGDEGDYYCVASSLGSSNQSESATLTSNV